MATETLTMLLEMSYCSDV